MRLRAPVVVVLAMVAVLIAGATIALASSRHTTRSVQHCRMRAHRRCPAAGRVRHRASTTMPNARGTGKPKPMTMPMPMTTTTTTTTAAASTTSANTSAAATSPAAPAATPTPTTTTTATTTTSTTSAVAPARLQVTAQDTPQYSFTLSRPDVAAGPVIIEFVNAGQDPHTLHIAPVGGGGDVAAFPLTSPGAHEDLEFTLAAGTYTLYCSLPGHEAMGMMATLTVD